MPAAIPPQPLDPTEEALLEAGLALIREKGVRKMTVEEAVRRVGVGKRTLYRLYPTKEAFALACITHGKAAMWRAIDGLARERGGLGRGEVAALLGRFSFDGGESVLGEVSPEDMAWLAGKLPGRSVLDPAADEAVFAAIASHLRGMREGVDPHVAANMMKVMAPGRTGRACTRTPSRRTSPSCASSSSTTCSGGGERCRPPSSPLRPRRPACCSPPPYGRRSGATPCSGTRTSRPRSASA